MELRVLRYFLAVVREENITAAAESLHLTQPTLSRQLMELEEELGSQLLIRGGRNQKIVLTEKGMLLRRRAEELVELADKTQLEINSDENEIAGVINIGGGESEAMRLVARAATQLKDRYPGIHYQLYSGNAEDVKERLDKGLLDFGVFIEPTDLQKYEYMRLKATDSWGLLVRRDHPLARQKSFNPQDLKELPLLVSRQHSVEQSFAKWYGSQPDLNIVGSYNLLFNAALMVDEGFGCALCLNRLANTSLASSLCFLPADPPVEANLDMAWKKYQIFSKAADLFLNQMRRYGEDRN